MSISGSRPVFYPNVTQVPAQNEQDAQVAGKGVKGGAFDEALNKALNNAVETPLRSDLGNVQAPLKFSAHATQRLLQRNIALDQLTMSRINDAVAKASAKGVQDTLVLMDDAALIVNVPNRTVVTAMDKAALDGNVFTNIDGAVIV